MIQITDYGDVDMTGYGISDIVLFAFFRDSDNTSGLFAGSDPSSETEITIEFDVHYRRNTLGSRQEYIK